MTIKECYKQMGADFAAISARLPNEALITRLAKKFPDDPSYPALTAAMENGDVQQAFRAAHTLKGVCLNLGFGNLSGPVAELTELLRAGTMEGSRELFEKTVQEYERSVQAIKGLD